MHNTHNHQNTIRRKKKPEKYKKATKLHERRAQKWESNEF